MPKVEVPTRYRGPTNGLGLIEVDADTVRACIEAVEARHPGFRELVLDGEGNLRRFVRLCVNGEVLDRDSVDAAVADGDCLQILAAAAGG
ncbi:MAG: MoaD/ThiS family protein [Myxococcota bacterium]|nr:MoaD/ThiS family protein [Myxococcota bacterium]